VLNPKDQMMFSYALGTIALIACLIVAVILPLGFGGFAKGGEARGKASNKLMQYRIAAQFVAVLIILAIVWYRRQG
jgi:hypothetical protein